MIMIKTVEHLQLTPLSLLPLAFFFGMAFSATSRMTPRHRLGGGYLRGRGGEKLGIRREIGGSGWGGVDGRAARRSARAQRSVFLWFLLCWALLYAMTMMWGL
jgi:hypothetical protein